MSSSTLIKGQVIDSFNYLYGMHCTLVNTRTLLQISYSELNVKKILFPFYILIL